jgi:O-antigen/teichoic acid export membrane protein
MNFKKIVRKLFSSAISRVAVYVAQMLSLMVFSRLLDVKDFGVFSVLNGACFLLMIISEFGVVQSVINEDSDIKVRGLGSESIKYATFSALISIPTILGMFYLFEIEQNVEVIIYVFSIVLFYGITSIHVGLAYKEYRFYDVARAEVLGEFLGLSLGYAYIKIFGPVYTALILKVLIYVLVRYVYLKIISAKKGHAELNCGIEYKNVFNIFRGIDKFKLGVISSGVLSFCVRQGDNFLIGKLFGLVQLGVYDRAYQLVKYPVMLMSFSLQPAVQPILRELKTYKDIRNIIIITWSACFILGSALFLIIYFYHELIVSIVLGGGWGDVYKIMVILAYSIPFQAFFSISGGFYYALESAHKNAVLNFVTFSFIISSIVFSYIKNDFYLGMYLISISFFVVSVYALIDLLRTGKHKFKETTA